MKLAIRTRDRRFEVGLNLLHHSQNVALRRDYYTFSIWYQAKRINYEWDSITYSLQLLYNNIFFSLVISWLLVSNLRERYLQNLVRGEKLKVYNWELVKEIKSKKKRWLKLRREEAHILELNNYGYISLISPSLHTPTSITMVPFFSESMIRQQFLRGDCRLKAQETSLGSL